MPVGLTQKYLPWQIFSFLMSPATTDLLQAPPWVGGACVETRDWTCVPNYNLSKKLSRVHESHNWHSRTHDNKGGDSAPDNGCNVRSLD